MYPNRNISNKKPAHQHSTVKRHYLRCLPALVLSALVLALSACSNGTNTDNPQSDTSNNNEINSSAPFLSLTKPEGLKQSSLQTEDMPSLAKAFNLFVQAAINSTGTRTDTNEISALDTMTLASNLGFIYQASNSETRRELERAMQDADVDIELIVDFFKLFLQKISHDSDVRNIAQANNKSCLFTGKETQLNEAFNDWVQSSFQPVIINSKQDRHINQSLTSEQIYNHFSLFLRSCSAPYSNNISDIRPFSTSQNSLHANEENPESKVDPSFNPFNPIRPFSPEEPPAHYANVLNTDDVSFFFNHRLNTSIQATAFEKSRTRFGQHEYASVNDVFINTTVTAGTFSQIIDDTGSSTLVPLGNGSKLLVLQPKPDYYNHYRTNISNYLTMLSEGEPGHTELLLPAKMHLSLKALSGKSMLNNMGIAQAFDEIHADLRNLDAGGRFASNLSLFNSFSLDNNTIKLHGGSSLELPYSNRNLYANNGINIFGSITDIASLLPVNEACGNDVKLPSLHPFMLAVVNDMEAVKFFVEIKSIKGDIANCDNNDTGTSDEIIKAIHSLTLFDIHTYDSTGKICRSDGRLGVNCLFDTTEFTSELTQLLHALISVSNYSIEDFFQNDDTLRLLQIILEVLPERGPIELDPRTPLIPPDGPSPIIPIDYGQFPPEILDPTLKTSVVYISDSSTQCAIPYDGLSTAETAQPLEAAGIKVLKSECGYIGGLAFSTVCGGNTGRINLHTIDSKDLEAATKIADLGFGYLDMASWEYGYLPTACRH